MCRLNKQTLRNPTENVATSLLTSHLIMYHIHEKKNYRCLRDCNTEDDVANITTRFGEITI